MLIALMASFWQILKTQTTVDRLPDNSCKRDKSHSPTKEVRAIVNSHSGQITALEVYNKYNAAHPGNRTIADVISTLNYLVGRGEIKRVFGEVFTKVTP